MRHARKVRWIIKEAQRNVIVIHRLEILSRMPNSMTEYQVRLESAMSIIRLVNGITDSGQKGKVASSVASIANDTGKLLLSINQQLEMLKERRDQSLKSAWRAFAYFKHEELLNLLFLAPKQASVKLTETPILFLVYLLSKWCPLNGKLWHTVCGYVSNFGI